MTANVKAWLLCAAATTILVPAAQAQQTSEKSPDDATKRLETIQVTAQKRSQSLNEVPISVVAFSGAELNAKGIKDGAELASIVPGLTFTPSPYSGTPIYTLRGIGFYEFSLPSSPAVTVYTDEVPLPYQAMTPGASLDMERVEILKGPQGTLFGQNSTGGAINYVAARPGDSVEFGGSASYSNFNELDAEAYLSGPVTDTLGVRAAVRSVQGGNWQESYTRNDELGASDRLMGRILFDWQPSDNLSIVVNLNGWTDKSDNQAGQLLAIQPTSPATAYPNLLNQPLPPKNDARAADWTPNWPMKNDDTFGQASVRADWTLNDTLTLTSISAKQTLEIEKYSDVDGTAAVVLDLYNPGSINSFNQELRLAGTGDNTNWIVGANYATADLKDRLVFAIDDLSVNTPIPGFPSIPISAGRTKQEHEAWALFGNVDYNLTNHWGIQIGARYTEDTKNFEGCSYDASGFTGPVFEVLQGLFNPTIPVEPVGLNECFTFGADFRPENFVDELQEDNLSWKSSLNYTSDNGTLMYGSVSRGYKAGAYPTLSTTTTTQYEPVTQEELTAFELGIKSPLFQGRSQVNAAAFYYDYKDKQLRSRLADPIFGLLEALVNVPESHVYGAEVEWRARWFDDLNTSLSATYVKSEIDQYVGLNQAAALQDFAGDRFPYTPELSFTFDADYKWALSDRLNGTLGGTLIYNSDSDATIDPTAAGTISSGIYEIDAYTLLNLQAGIEATDGTWSLQVWGRNVTDEYYWSNVFQSLDTVYRHTGKPATYGVRLTLRR
ncbi:TonB-dependent receptor [Hyphomonas sp.]|uniref:TonB-dependent receptor n=1 Tax=Hyphomonas sp. TaxID=87 RepID=UPI003F731142